MINIQPNKESKVNDHGKAMIQAEHLTRTQLNLALQIAGASVPDRSADPAYVGAILQAIATNYLAIVTESNLA